ncbi:MAG: class flavin-dependent oxidoreductase [Solirubrobacterales bacterium]|nr:class flavin-dependent oxidoreductase [Solirubrobacterales bacterium]
MPELRWGLTVPFAGVSLADHRPFFEQAEARGYDDLWSGEATGYDGFTPLVLAAAWTERLRLATGVVNPYTRGVPVLAQTAAALQDASRGRFVLGLGSSSDVIVERWNGVPFAKPLTRVREAVAALRPVLAGERGPGGFKLEQAPATPVPIHVAALRDRMLRLGGEVADGTMINFTPIGSLAHVVEQIRAGEAAGGREPGSTEVVCRFFCIPAEVDEGLPFARHLFAAYGTVPVYEAFFRGLGWGDRLDPMVDAWRAGDRKLAVEKAPEDLLREIFIFGPWAAQKARLDEFAAGGVTTFALTPICGPDQLAAAIDGLARG